MDIRYFLSRFWRRIHWFLLVALLISGVSLVVARELPPVFESSTILIVERPTIEAGAEPIPAQTQLGLVRQRLGTRANYLEIARRHQVFENINQMTPDEVVNAMRGATRMRVNSRGGVPRMSISFEARSGRIAAAVLNDYLTIIEQEDNRRGAVTAGQTLDFFDEEVERFEAMLNQVSEQILAFNDANADALPGSLGARTNQQSNLQDRILQIERELVSLDRRRDQMERVFEINLSTSEGGGRSPAERRVDSLQRELDAALITFAPSNPRIRVLQSQLSAAEQLLEAERAAATEADTEIPLSPSQQRARAMLDLELDDIEFRRGNLEAQRDRLQERLVELESTLERIPVNQITLASLERERANIQNQYNRAVARRNQAATGERIEALGRSQRIVVVEPPAVPSGPSGPDRLFIAGAGTGAGIGAGLALVVLLELLSRVPKRPVDLTRRFGITPIATIPYVPTRGQTLRRRAARLGVIISGLALGPLALWLVHTQYRPLDLLLRDVVRAAGF